MLAAYILAAVTIALTTWIFVTWKKRKNYPPGPFPLPFIGNLHLLRKDIHIAMDELSKQYGDMFTLWMTDIPYIVITDITLAKKVALTKKFANRLPLYVGDKLYSRGCKDIIFGDYGEALILHKRMAHSALSMFGKGLLCFEDRIMSSVDALINTLDENKENEMFSLHDDVELACFNVMSSIVLGTSMDKEDERFQKLRNAVFYMMQSGVTLSLINFYPILRYLPNKDLKGMIKVLSERDEVLKNILDYTISTYQCGQVTNYIEALLKAKSDIEETEGQGYVSNILSRDHIEMNIFDMFLGGVETVSTTLMWALLYLMKWPETQRKCHCELDKVLGLPNERSRVVYKDKDSLPYLQAVVLETLRLASTLPFGVFHKAREDVELNGYRIQKETATMINIWSIHHDEKNYNDPLIFKPERFLDESGKLIPLSERTHFFAFSCGPRQCIGQSLGKTELFLFLANLLQHFHFKSSPLNEKLSIYGTTKVTHAPHPYKIYASRRHGDNNENKK